MKKETGVQFLSKHGRPPPTAQVCAGRTWMRNVDAGLDEPTTVRFSAEISETVSAFEAALERCKIKSR